MKALRVTALGLVVALCLLTPAPAALADEVWRPRAVTVRPGEWIAGWLERAAEWLGWERGGPRAVTDFESCGIDPDGAPRPCPPGGTPAVPAPVGDESCGLDSDGAPCRP